MIVEQVFHLAATALIGCGFAVAALDTVSTVRGRGKMGWAWQVAEDLFAALGFGSLFVYDVLHARGPSAAGTVDGALTLMWAYILWSEWRRRPPRNRRKVREVLGAKARAARARLVAAMPSPRPLPA